MVAFEDKVKIYGILLTKIKYLAEFSIKRCQQIVYSYGGQFVACRYGRGINSSIIVLNLLRLVEVAAYKIQAEPLQVIWGEHDDCLVVTTDTNMVQTYKIS